MVNSNAEEVEGEEKVQVAAGILKWKICCEQFSGILFQIELKSEDFNKEFNNNTISEA